MPRVFDKVTFKKIRKACIKPQSQMLNPTTIRESTNQRKDLVFMDTKLNLIKIRQSNQQEHKQ